MLLMNLKIGFIGIILFTILSNGDNLSSLRFTFTFSNKLSIDTVQVNLEWKLLAEYGNE